jgi:4'-phosphopantetheinyl transferase
MADLSIRSEWITAHEALRDILGRYSDSSPDTLEFSAEPRKKPRLLPGPGASWVPEFNLSHTSGVAILAVARDTPVGVDIERIRPVTELDDLMARFLSPRERDEISRVPAAERLDAFYRCWTRKEAILKAAGIGLSGELDQFSVDWTHSHESRIHDVSQHLPFTDCWSIVDLHAPDGCVAALASPNPVTTVGRFHWHGASSAIR